LQLQVWHHAAHVGTLSLNDEGRWSFAYDASWTAFALSPHLPIHGGATTDLVHQRSVEWFFDNLLPEGALRGALAEREALSKEDSWGLLARYGPDTAGALSVLPDAIAPDERQKIRPLSQERLAQMIERSKQGVPLMAQDGKPRMSLAGAQEKIALRVDDAGGYWMPEGTTPSTHILKPENPNKGYPFCPANEWFCMSLAKGAGLRAPKVQLRSVGPHRVYVVQRFDRTSDVNGVIRRLHQIDLCQAMNVPPKKKYEDEGGLGVKDLFLVAKTCRVPAVAISESMKWIVFNYIIGNGDAHAKNVSFMMTGQMSEVSPVYDLLCVDAYHKNNHLTMAIGGQSQAGWVEGCHWDALALENGADPRALRPILEQVSAGVRKARDSILESGELTTIERGWLREHAVPVIDQRLSFVDEARASPISNIKTIQEKRRIVDDHVLANIAQLAAATTTNAKKKLAKEPAARKPKPKA
jgi:serine/threonine-protein kinase HipA